MLVACAAPGESVTPTQADQATANRAGAGHAPEAVAAASTLGAVQVEQRALRAASFAAEAALMFPEESRALTRALLRQEFARLEAARLAIAADPAELARALEATTQGLAAEAERAGGLEAWALERYGQSWNSVRLALSKRLELNQLYQLCARAWSLQVGQVELRMLSTREQETAAQWARKLRAGASAEVLASASLDPGPHGDGRTPWLPAVLPAPIGKQFSATEAGELVGPFQFDGEAVWRVAQLVQRREPTAMPPRGEILRSLREQPISPLEERAWFEAMLARYNARDGIPAVETPQQAFVRRTPR